MAPKYKLIYFNIRGVAEPIRYLLSYMNEEFEETRIEPSQWEANKSSTPFGKLPILEENGKTLTQTIAIARYLGKKAGLVGKDDWENIQIDIMADTLVDLRLSITAYFKEPNEEIKKAMQETYYKETLPFYLKKLDAVTKENGGYLANKKLSWADFVFTSLSEFLNAETPNVLADYPNLYSLQQKVLNLPQIKKWIAKRPVTHF